MSAEPRLLDAVRGQPKQVWITAFAAVIAFMGIGLVDPILLSIAEGLHATPSEVTALFSAYLGVQVVAMLLTGIATARFGAKRTVVIGLTLIVITTALCAAAGSIQQLIALRAGWGLGNALFIATALSVIVGQPPAASAAPSCCTRPRSAWGCRWARCWVPRSATCRCAARSSARPC